MRLKEYITEAKKKVSAAVLMTDGHKLLIVHPTGWASSEWELPKGNIDDSESDAQAAVREFYEETGQKISISGLRKVGRYNLHSGKDIILFTYSIDNLPPISSMRCLSVFHPNQDKGDLKTTSPEIDKWKYITPEEIDKYVRKKMTFMIRKGLK